MRLFKSSIISAAIIITAALILAPRGSADDHVTPSEESPLDVQLDSMLRLHDFTGNVEATLEQRLGRKINEKLADVGRLLFFDPVLSLSNDSSCASCHSPTSAMSDTQSIAMGVGNNGVVGPDRQGPRNQRRAPSIINTAFYPNLMWNSRFSSVVGDPFNNSQGFSFPAPEGMTLSHLPHLLAAQAFIPVTVRVEMACFDFEGDSFRMRTEILNRLNGNKRYRKLFGKVFREVKRGAPIRFEMVGQAIAEFEFTLTFANSPLDRFARGERKAMTDDQKRGALLFFGKGNCVLCHAVSGTANEMFSDFTQRVIGVPQIMPRNTNVEFDGDEKNEDFGLEQVTGNPNDRYKFRTAPLRNVGAQAAFFHNGAFTTLEDAINHYRDVKRSARNLEGVKWKLSEDLRGPVGPDAPVLARVNPFLIQGILLNEEEFRLVVEFVRNGLLDPRAKPENLRKLIPESVPSGLPLQQFQ
ncbi:MAG TPA: cytochrome c peroxidase [Blastocatellia bacterium]|nr:cytochrome c peroxidase [Blastocatellia bacterium]